MPTVRCFEEETVPEYSRCPVGFYLANRYTDLRVETGFSFEFAEAGSLSPQWLVAL